MHHRKISPQDNGNNPKFDYDYIIPIVDPSLPDLRCGRNATKAWSRPKTAVVHAGDTVGFARWPNLYHPGPATAWLSRAPGLLDEYEGDGDWFKILSVVGRTNHCGQIKFPHFPHRTWNFTIPERTPTGDYLLRFEHIYPLPVDSIQGAQFYTNCAHVRIVNSESDEGTPGPLVKIPGIYTFGQKGRHHIYV
ncbi:lytic polysaccharide monooxygenase [Periconia macrospinosa]|uniref:lytic cellulose monooxygenase (C4-dehydrogenating) n=1 Tax=Periconia macrospinosa TaxID=97972 RepID=A0A2V1DR02_9PLEO|nr:lytic polysaccharide monooxygenase [Periconia macrospinosa]